MRKPTKTNPLTEWANISDAIFHHAKSRPSAPAIISGKSEITYKQFAALVAKAAVYLHQLGIKPGEVVAALMSNSIDHLILSFALIRIGAVPLDMPPKRPANAPVDPFKRFKIDRAFVEPGAMRPKSGTIHDVDAKWRASIEKLKGDHRYAGNPDEVYYLSVTSGSTGLPKGVITTHRQWMARYDSATRLLPKLLDANKPPRLLLIGGMGFSAFFFFLANQIFIGGPVVLLPETPDMDRMIEAINAQDDSVTLITPAMFRQLVGKAPEKGVLFPKMRALCIGAAPLYPEEKRVAQSKLTKNFYEVYGSAACGFLSALPPEEVADKADSVGRIVPEVTIEIVDSDGRPVPAGEVGHLRCRGAGISKGFVDTGDPEPKSAEGFRDGWYYPGDLAALPGDGHVYLRGRITDLINRGGIEIFPMELEKVFLAHASVADAACVNGPVNEKGDQVIVFVVPRGEPRKDELAAYCRANIPPEKFPDRVFYARELPKNANGKVDRVKLKVAAVRGPAGQKVEEKAH